MDHIEAEVAAAEALVALGRRAATGPEEAGVGAGIVTALGRGAATGPEGAEVGAGIMTNPITPPGTDQEAAVGAAPEEN